MARRAYIIRILFVSLVAIAFGWITNLPLYFGKAFHTEQMLCLVYGLSVAAIFLSRPAIRPVAAWFDALAAISMLSAMAFVSFRYDWVLIKIALADPVVVALAAISLGLTLEALRRTAGTLLFILVLVFVAYALVGHIVPGALSANYNAPDYLIPFLAFDASSMLGLPMRIGATVVLAYVFFGQLLFKSGGGEFFTHLATAITGRSRGGPAKIAIVGSALFGTISGSATSNVASTGIITIPLMQRAGYSPRTAGAIEAVASTGGQLMPPILGAAAFLMAEFLSIPYTMIVVAAIGPSILYYFGLFVQIDLIAAKERLSVTNIDSPRASHVLIAGFHFIVPFFVLVVALFNFGLEPEVAAVWSILFVVLGSAIRSYFGHKLTSKGFLEALYETGQITAEMLIILAAAGIVIGVLNVTGGGFGLTLLLLSLGDGNTFILLLVTAAICMLLGMGMPTSGVYVLLAALIAPALVEAGVQPLASHLFILYFGMLSMITPPIALACFAAAALTKDDPLLTSVTAVKLAWIAYIIPFMFVLSPSLMFQTDALSITIDMLTALFGVYLCSIAIIGYWRSLLRTYARILVGVFGLMSIIPGSAIPHGQIIVVAGVLGGALVMLWLQIRERKALFAK